MAETVFTVPALLICKGLCMATVRLNKVKKIYPFEEKKSKKGTERNVEEASASSLQITKEGVIAVQDFTLDIRDREFIVIVGPSGCGKSTTLRMIAGLDEISDGELYIDDKLMNTVAPKDRDIAMVFQNYALYPHFTVYNNMAFSLKLRKMPKDVIDKKVREAAEILDITELLNRKPRALSGGQRQRVAIGRAIVREPKLLLMDEPLSNLDAKLRNQTRAELIKLRQRISTTFIYVTHDQVEAMTLGDRIVVMKDGFIQQTGTPFEVFTHPKNLFVATFIGAPQMNILEDVTLHKENGAFFIDCLGSKIRLSEKQQEALSDNYGDNSQQVIVGIRPVDIELVNNGIKGIISVMEMMGAEVHLHIDIGNQEIVSVVPLNGLDITHLKPGEEVDITFMPENIHIFNRETKNNIL